MESFFNFSYDDKLAISPASDSFKTMLNLSSKRSGDSYLSPFLPSEELGYRLFTLLSNSSINQLEHEFLLLVSHVFGTGNGISWNLRTVQEESEAFHIISNFLSPNGPMFELCYRLCSDENVYFNLPYENLVGIILSDVNNLGQFYSSRLHFDQKEKMYFLSLDALEYYMFNFAYHLVDPNVIVPEHDCSKLTVYSYLVTTYLKHFLPHCYLPYKSAHSFSLSSSHEQSDTNAFYFNRSLENNEKPSIQIFRSNIGSNGIGNYVNSVRHIKPSAETWYTEMMVQIFIDFWLGTENNSNRNNQLVQSLFYNQSVSACTEHFKCIRSLFKQLHYFSYYYVPGNESAMNKFRKEVISRYCVTIYHYFRYAVKHYAFNISFVWLVESWLSYIQPWRYTCDARCDSELNSIQISNWRPFIAENLLTYTNIYFEFMFRFMNVDVADYKCVTSLLRITKVFSQPSLMSSIREVESCLNENNVNSMYGWRIFVKQNIQLMENQQYIYVPFYSEQHASRANQIVSRIKNCVQMLRNNDNQLNGIGHRSSGLMNKFIVGNNQDAFSASVGELVTCLKQLSVIHSIHLNLSSDFINNSVDVTDHSNFYNNSDDSSILERSTFKSMIQQWTQNVLSISSEGHPDRRSIQSGELGFLVELFNSVCDIINARYSEEIRSLYSRSDFLGGIARQIIQPPQMFQAYKKRSLPYGYTERVSVPLPPRISLRRLASTRLITKFSFAFIFFLLLGFSVYEILFMFALCYVLYLVVMTLLEPVPIVID